MFNPAYPFTEELYSAFQEKGVVHFVRSTYARGVNAEVKEAFLISHYHQRSEAERHYNAIRKDPRRKLYNLSHPGDEATLWEHTSTGGHSRAFSKLIHPENEKRANRYFKENTKRFLFTHTAWDLKGAVVIFPKFRFQLGELYVRIAHKGDEIIVPFKDIENS